MEVDRLRQKALRGEAMTIEECKKAVMLCRDHRLKTRPSVGTSAARSAPTPRLSSEQLLKGLL